MSGERSIHQTRVVLAALDAPATVRLLRVQVVDGWDDLYGTGVVPAAGQATARVINAPQAERLDQIEAAGQRRPAVHVDDVTSASARRRVAGAPTLHGAGPTPWGHRQRLTRGGVPLTLVRPAGARTELP